jgi:hypothetical protein
MLKILVGPLLVFMVMIAGDSSAFAFCINDCDLINSNGVNVPFDDRGIQVDQPAVDFFLLGTDGHAINLSKLWADKPLFLEFGSYT